MRLGVSQILKPHDSQLLQIVQGSLLILALIAAFNLPVFAAGNPQATSLYQQGVEAYNRQQTPQAISLFEQAVAADPQFSDGWYNLGSLQYRAKNYEKARLAYEKVLALNPTDAQARYSLALALEKLGKMPEALAQYQKVTSGSAAYARAQEKVVTLKKAMASKPAAASTPASASATTPVKLPAVQPIATTPASTGSKALKPLAYVQGLSGPTGMALGPRGELYIANFSKNSVLKVEPGGVKTVFSEGKELQGPIGLVRDPRTGDLLVANYLKGTVVSIGPKGEQTVVATGLQKPYNLLLDSLSGTLYVSEQGTNAVSKIAL